MDYNSQLRAEAEKSVRPLFDQAGNVKKQLVTLQHQLERETGNKTALDRRLNELKKSAGDRISAGQNAYEAYRRSLRKLTGDLAASEEIARTLRDELVPGKESEFIKVQAAVQSALLAAAAQVRPACEAEMVRWIEAALAERDSYMAAAETVFAEYGGNFRGRNKQYPEPCHFRPDPIRSDFLIATGLDETLVDAKAAQVRRGPYLAQPPAESQASATGEAHVEPSHEPRSTVEAPQDAPHRVLTGLLSNAGGRSGPEADLDTPAAVLAADDDDDGPEMLPLDSVEGQGREAAAGC